MVLEEVASDVDKDDVLPVDVWLNEKVVSLELPVDVDNDPAVVTGF